MGGGCLKQGAGRAAGCRGPARGWLPGGFARDIQGFFAFPAPTCFPCPYWAVRCIEIQGTSDDEMGATLACEGGRSGGADVPCGDSYVVQVPQGVASAAAASGGRGRRETWPCIKGVNIEAVAVGVGEDSDRIGEGGPLPRSAREKCGEIDQHV